MENLEEKIKQLVGLIKKSKNIVIYTGAGISTDADIPDIRSPNGLENNRPPMIVLGIQEKELEYKMPTFSHIAIAQLMKLGIFKTVITSNHDNLHVKGGVNPSDMVDLYGNVYVEKCGRCGLLYHRDCITPTLGRFCDNSDCGGKLMKTGTRMNAITPEKPLLRAIEFSQNADLAIVLGSSMQVTPFCELPKNADHMVICNLQETPYDDQAVLIIRDRCDTIMRRVTELLNIQIPNLEYKIKFVIESQKIADQQFKLLIHGTHPNVPCMCIEEASIHFLGKNYNLEQNQKLAYVKEIYVPDGTLAEDLKIDWIINFKPAFEVQNLSIQSYSLFEGSRECELVKVMTV